MRSPNHAAGANGTAVRDSQRVPSFSVFHRDLPSADSDQNPASRIRMAAATRLSTPSLVKILVRLAFTVARDM